MLVLSELVTNAGRHAYVSPGREIETRYVRLADTLRIEVHDATPERPEKREPAAEDCEGARTRRGTGRQLGRQRPARARQGCLGGAFTLF